MYPRHPRSLSDLGDHSEGRKVSQNISDFEAYSRPVQQEIGAIGATSRQRSRLFPGPTGSWPPDMDLGGEATLPDGGALPVVALDGVK